MDAWRQEGMCDLIQPIIASGAESRWLTVGDSGADAAALAAACIPSGQIVASSLCAAQLERLNSAGAKLTSNRYQVGTHRLALWIQDLLAAVHLMSWGKAVLVLAKQPLPKALKQRLDAAGFQRFVLPKNPYFTAAEDAALPLPQ